MTPEELARSKAAAIADPKARDAARFAAYLLAQALAQRGGVVTRAELKAAGLTRSDIDRLLRRNSLRQVHRTAYVDHTGPLTYDQRICTAVLALAPAVLDGRLGHDSFDAESRDAARDLDDLTGGRTVARLRWRQVFGTPCLTAGRIGTMLQERGWQGAPTPCRRDCAVATA